MPSTASKERKQLSSSQSDFFKQTTLPLVEDVLLKSQNALLFAYGVTNSGKTYSMQGGQGEGQEGIIPRTLDVIFNSIGELKANHDFRPSKVSAVESTRQSPHGSILSGLSGHRNQHAQFFHDVFPGRPSSVSQSEDMSFDLDKNYKYAIWISFAEIYNEKVYDLLESLPSTSNLQPSNSVGSMGTAASKKTTIVVKRKALGLRSDRDADAKYIEGLREVRCDSPEQARALLELGTHNRQVFSTLANRASSRSHSIFNIRVMRVHGAAQRDPNAVSFSRLSLVDLAGSERSKNTGNTGERLREAGNINKSLMVLGQCMETLRTNQRRQESKKPVPVPFRHSKLTEIFQSFFVGDGKAVMLVHCNPFDTSFMETSHVMKFSAVARDVTVSKAPSSMLPKKVNTTIKDTLGAIRERIGHTHHSQQKAIKGSDESLSEKFVNVEVGDQSIAMEDEPDTDSNLTDDEEEGSELDSDDENDPFTEFLFSELQEMKERWLEAEMRCAEIEMETREECLELMREQLTLQEVEFADRLRAESEQSEINTNRKIELVNQLHTASQRRRDQARFDVLGEEEDETLNKSMIDKENINDSLLNTPTINRDGKNTNYDAHQLYR
ncbi:kinesin-domain-containing protein [Wallemia mellicola]|uniref:Kinesin-like protein n=1 Tax=Wallemia mellicola TaxID=1708541 RepID=A0A4T0QTF7_9BASI|nr:kinesin-domain-containing protein [Wallemia mellicola]TIC27781.1 kinesin-domain-containing protein [Wallemia mellicola]